MFGIAANNAALADFCGTQSDAAFLSGAADCVAFSRGRRWADVAGVLILPARLTDEA